MTCFPPIVYIHKGMLVVKKKLKKYVAHQPSFNKERESHILVYFKVLKVQSIFITTIIIVTFR